ncbi:hypothetical protein [Azospirillum argentinense]
MGPERSRGRMKGPGCATADVAQARGREQVRNTYAALRALS